MHKYKHKNTEQKEERNEKGSKDAKGIPALTRSAYETTQLTPHMLQVIIHINQGARPVVAAGAVDPTVPASQSPAVPGSQGPKVPGSQGLETTSDGSVRA